MAGKPKILRWLGLIAALALSGTAHAQNQLLLSSGELDYIRHVESLMGHASPDPTFAQSADLLGLAEDLYFVSGKLLAGWPKCRDSSDEPRACVLEILKSSAPPRLLGTDIEAACSLPERGYQTAPQIVTCLLSQWQKSWQRVEQIDQTFVRTVPCSYPEELRQRFLKLARMEEAHDQSRVLVAITDWKDQDIAYGAASLQQFEGQFGDRVTRELTEFKKVVERFKEFSEILARDPGREELSTLLAISTAMQRFANCLNRHPERQAAWEALSEGSGAPSWGPADVPIATSAAPIDLTAAAQRTLRAITTAQAPRPPEGDMPPPALDSELAPPDTEEARRKADCQQIENDKINILQDRRRYQRILAFAKNPALGCEGERLRGTLGYLQNEDLSSFGAAQLIASSDRSKSNSLLRAISKAFGSFDLGQSFATGVTAAGCGSGRKAACVNQNARGSEQFDPTEGHSSLPGSNLSIEETNEMIRDLDIAYNALEAQITIKCLSR